MCCRRLIFAAIVFILPYQAVAFLRLIPNPSSLGCRLHPRHKIAHALSMQQNVTQDSDRLSPWQLSFSVSDQGQLTCDMCAILIASQLIGLLDVVNDPVFLRNGGWLQPIPAVPSTLDSLIQRVALISCIWFPLSIFRLPFVQNASNFVEKDRVWLVEVAFTFLLFSVLRFGIASTMSFFSGQDIDTLHILRDCYLVGLTATSFRLLYREYFG